MTALIWSHSARRDLFTIAAFYETFDPDLPEVLLDRTAQAPLMLLDYPRSGSRTSFPGVRKWRVPETPFILLYAERRGRIEIRRVMHQRSDLAGASVME